MTYKPKVLADAMAFWVAHGGADGGIVGDAAHALRPTYHNGWDRAVSRYGTTDMAVVASKDYTYAQKRDQVKSDAAMGIDLSWPLANKTPLYKVGTWLVEQCKAGAPDTDALREVIWSPDGVYVKRWDYVSKQVYTSLRKNSDGSITVLKTGQGDASHFWHDHIGCFRDSEARPALLALLRRYFEEDDDMVKAFGVPEKPTLAYLKPDPAAPTKSVWLHVYSDFRDDLGNKQLSPNRPLPYVGGWGDVRIVAYEPTVEDTNATSTAMFVKATEVAKYEVVPAPAPVTDESPFTQAQVDVLVKQGQSAAAAAVAQAGIGALTTAAGKYP
jgi:hypothetical protein